MSVCLSVMAVSVLVSVSVYVINIAVSVLVSLSFVCDSVVAVSVLY